MKLTHKIDINENIITASIAVEELGTSSIESDEEYNQLHNFTRDIEYRHIDFKSNMKIVNGIPVTTSEETDDSTIEEVALKDLINKKIPLDDKFATELIIDVNKIPESAFGEHVFKSKELVGQAYAVLFIDKIKEAISQKLTEIRALSNGIEKTTDVII